MRHLSYKSEIKKTFKNVRSFSYNEKLDQKSPVTEEAHINSLLDKINDYRDFLVKKTNLVDEINESIEKLTWIDGDLDEECLMLMNDLISSIKDLHSSLIRRYISMKFLRSKGIAKKEIRDFKNSVDDLKESYEDLESVFFFLPKIPEFKETTKKLSLV